MMQQQQSSFAISCSGWECIVCAHFYSWLASPPCEVAEAESRDEAFVDGCLPVLAANDVTKMVHFRSLPEHKPFVFAAEVTGGKRVSF